jgi:hypothetical protein
MNEFTCVSDVASRTLLSDVTRPFAEALAGDTIVTCCAPHVSVIGNALGLLRIPLCAVAVLTASTSQNAASAIGNVLFLMAMGHLLVKV